MSQKKHLKKASHSKIVDIIHSTKTAGLLLGLGFVGFTLGIMTKPSLTGAAIVDSPEVTSTTFFSTLIIILSFMMVWTGVMIYLMKVEIKGSKSS